MPTFGLRSRLLAALVLTSVVTLIAAAIALLSPLQSQLRRDSVSATVAAVGAAKVGFTEIEHIGAQLSPIELGAQVRSLERRASARVAVLDGRLQTVYDTDPEQPVSMRLAARALSTGAPQHDVDDQELQVAQPLHIERRPYVIVARRRLSYVQESSHVVRDVFLKAAAVGLVVALVLGIALSARMVRRLERLLRATRSFDEDEITSIEPLDRSSDEIGELARSFAALRERLRRQEEARRAFVATASHELRTPIASLDGTLELLADDLEDPVDLDDARARIERAREVSRSLANLAGDLLDLSRIDAAVDLRSEPVELAEVARAVGAEFELRAGRREVELELIGTESQCWAQGDPGSVARIVRILLDNALHVAPPHTTITVRVETGKQWAELEVRDEGPGVPDSQRELIFERFQRGSDRAGGGFGLGLAIGRELAERMGGSLELADLSPGATFQLHLHTAPVPVEA